IPCIPQDCLCLRSDGCRVFRRKLYCPPRQRERKNCDRHEDESVSHQWHFLLSRCLQPPSNQAPVGTRTHAHFITKVQFIHTLSSPELVPHEPWYVIFVRLQAPESIL